MLCPNGQAQSASNVSNLSDSAKPSRTLRIVVEYRGVVDQDQVTDLLAGRPYPQEIKRHSVVRLLFPFRRVRPVAAPDATFRSGFRISLRNRGRIGIRRWPNLCVGVVARQFDPGFSFIQRPDLREQRMIDTLGFGDVGACLLPKQRNDGEPLRRFATSGVQRFGADVTPSKCSRVPTSRAAIINRQT